MDPIHDLNEKAKELEQISTGTNIALTEMRVQFETLAEMQKEERIEIQKMHLEENERTRNHYDNVIRHYKHIIIGLIVTLCLFIFGLICAVSYVVTNYDFQFGYTQDLTVEGDGDATIQDGIHINSD